LNSFHRYPAIETPAVTLRVGKLVPSLQLRQDPATLKRRGPSVHRKGRPAGRAGQLRLTAPGDTGSISRTPLCRRPNLLALWKPGLSFRSRVALRRRTGGVR